MTEAPEIAALDRTSFVPLYYQLQETMKERIESGEWAPGDALPAEVKLAKLYGVSRVCVRQALTILEDDREIERVQGRGTFVARRKLAHRPSSIVGLRTADAPAGAEIRVLDRRVGGVEQVICSALDRPCEEILRITALWSVKRAPIAIGQHFFAVDQTPWPDASLAVGREVVPAITDGLVVGITSLTFEFTQCGQFEADLLGIPHRAPLLLTVSLIHAGSEGEQRPFEFARLGYRADTVRLCVP